MQSAALCKSSFYSFNDYIRLCLINASGGSSTEDDIPVRNSNLTLNDGDVLFVSSGPFIKRKDGTVETVAMNGNKMLSALTMQTGSKIEVTNTTRIWTLPYLIVNGDITISLSGDNPLYLDGIKMGGNYTINGESVEGQFIKIKDDEYDNNTNQTTKNFSSNSHVSYVFDRVKYDNLNFNKNVNAEFKSDLHEVNISANDATCLLDGTLYDSQIYTSGTAQVNVKGDIAASQTYLNGGYVLVEGNLYNLPSEDGKTRFTRVQIENGTLEIQQDCSFANKVNESYITTDDAYLNINGDMSKLLVDGNFTYKSNVDAETYGGSIEIKGDITIPDNEQNTGDEFDLNTANSGNVFRNTEMIFSGNEQTLNLGSNVVFASIYAPNSVLKCGNAGLSVYKQLSDLTLQGNWPYLEICAPLISPEVKTYHTEVTGSIGKLYYCGQNDSSLHVSGDVNLSQVSSETAQVSALILYGGKVAIDGNLYCQDNSYIDIEDGTVDIRNKCIIGKINEDGTYGFTNSQLYMSGSDAQLIVGSDFYMNAIENKQGTNDISNIYLQNLKAGSLVVKGNVSILNDNVGNVCTRSGTPGGNENYVAAPFIPANVFKMTFNGIKQNVAIDENTVLTRVSAQNSKLTFTKSTNINLYDLQSDLIIDGDLEGFRVSSSTGSNVTVNGNLNNLGGGIATNITINGNLNNTKDVTFAVYSGKVLVNGNFNFSSSNSLTIDGGEIEVANDCIVGVINEDGSYSAVSTIIDMKDAASKLLVHGNLYMNCVENGPNSDYTYLHKGTIETQGDVTILNDMSGTLYMNGGSGFFVSGFKPWPGYFSMIFSGINQKVNIANGVRLGDVSFTGSNTDFSSGYGLVANNLMNDAVLTGNCSHIDITQWNNHNVDINNVTTEPESVNVPNTYDTGKTNEDLVNKTYTYYCHVKPPKYKVTFTENGNTYTTYENLISNSLITEPTAPVDNDYIFGGWYKDSQFTIPWDFKNDKVQKDTILYAKMDFKYRNLELTIDPFNTVVYGSSMPGSKPVTIRNTGNCDMTINSYSLYGTGFVVGEGTKLIKAGEENTSWTLKPENNLEAGQYIATLVIECDDGYNYQYSVNGSILIEKMSQIKPGMPKIQRLTNDSIKLEQINSNHEGVFSQYRVNYGEWQNDSTFYNLSNNTDYVFQQRYSDSNNYAASEESTALTYHFVAHQIIDGVNQTVNPSTNTQVVFRSDADISKFAKVQVDNNDVDSRNYSVYSGSTIIKFNPDYISTLSSGQHSISIVSTDGVASTYFYIDKSSNVSPEPSPTENPVPTPTPAPVVEKTDMYRLYNPNSGEHFYTANAGERDMLQGVGWSYEGLGWTAPATSNTPVYRLYNANAGDHHYTMNAGEKDMLVSVGWSYEGIGWYSDDAQGVPLYRQYNPNAKAGSHNYTINAAERDMLVSIGWHDEGIGWYGVKN